jgi:hypothetical protein
MDYKPSANYSLSVGQEISHHILKNHKMHDEDDSLLEYGAA